MSRFVCRAVIKDTSPMQYFTEDPEEMKKQEAFALEADLVWRDLPLPDSLAKVASEYEKECGHGEVSFTFYLVSEASSPGGVWCNIHGHKKDGRLSFLQVTLSRKPSSPPPAIVTEISDKFGGYPSGFKSLLGEIFGETRACTADVRLVFGKTPLKIKPRSIGDELKPLVWKSEELTLTAPDGTEVEITFLEDEGVMVKVECEFPLAIGDNSFEAAAEILWNKMTPLIKNV